MINIGASIGLVLMIGGSLALSFVVDPRIALSVFLITYGALMMLMNQKE